MKALNVKSIAASLLLTAFVLTSCKKDKADAPAPEQFTIEGNWTGKSGSGNNTPNGYMNLVISKDGTLKARHNPDAQEYGNGTWKLTGETFTAVYQVKTANLNITYNVAGKYKPAEKKIDGDWGVGANDATLGTFYLNKQ